jgi:hypothetical protein
MIEEFIMDSITELCESQYSPLHKSPAVNQWRLWMELVSQSCFDVVTECLAQERLNEGSTWSPELSSIIEEVVNVELAAVIHEIADELVNSLIYERVANDIFDGLLFEIITEQRLVA